MRKFTGIMTSLSLGFAAAAGAPALAQQAPAAAAAVKLDVGTTVYDSEGAEIGKVTANDGANVVVMLGDKQVGLPITSFGQGEKGPALGITVAQLSAGIEQQAAAAGAALDAALVPGADIRSAQGTVVVGKVKSNDAEGVAVATAQGDVSLPKSAFFMSPQGLATSFTAEQFAAAVAEATAGAPAAEAVADAQDAATSEPAPTPAD